jgi:aryl-alcohol dehydrogenase-like predicted oxidoreductase
MADAVHSGLQQYYLLGRSGLRVSPLCLGAMTFGNDWGIGSEEKAARAIFDRYLAAGGNFIDTADMYNDGHSEEMLGKFMSDAKNRDRIVVATKFTFNMHPSDPNAGGNGRKRICEAVDASLKRLKTDYIDLYWMHVWDMLTPVEEAMETIDALVRAGKVRYFGLSDTPAWYASRGQTLAELRGWPRIVALQLEYSLIERAIEREYAPMARELGMGICPWSPLGSGLLSGKYTRESAKQDGEGRLSKMRTSTNPVFHKFTEKNFQIVDALLEVAKAIGRTPSQVALNWATKRPGIVSTIFGARTIEQLEDNIGALDFEIPSEMAAKLTEVSAIEAGFPYMFYEQAIQSRIQGERPIAARPPWY